MLYLLHDPVHKQAGTSSLFILSMLHEEARDEGEIFASSVGRDVFVRLSLP